MSDPIVLDYQNSLLRRSDVDLLLDNDWLNDTLIGFWFEYLEHEVFPDQDSILFIAPEVSHFIKLASAAETQLFIEPLNLSAKDYVFIPVNDSLSPDSPGGSHWSLLVFSRPDSCFYHLDSIAGSNACHAVRVAQRLKLSTAAPIEPPCLQQSNPYDCGIVTCCNAELWAQHLSKHHSHGTSFHFSPKLSQETVSSQRSRMLRIITSLSTRT